MNYNSETNKCYYGDHEWNVYRQFYDVYNWPGKTSGKWLVDHHRALVFDNNNCVPMKYDHKSTVAPNDYHFARRIIDSDHGFMERKIDSDVVEFGTLLTDAVAISTAT